MSKQIKTSQKAEQTLTNKMQAVGSRIADLKAEQGRLGRAAIFGDQEARERVKVIAEEIATLENQRSEIGGQLQDTRKQTKQLMGVGA